MSTPHTPDAAVVLQDRKRLPARFFAAFQGEVLGGLGLIAIS